MVISVKEEGATITGPFSAAKIFRNILLMEDEIDRDKEHFWAIGLNIKNVVLYVDLVSLGTLDSSLVGTREVFRMAILKAAASVIVGHNHPSGSLEISMNDRAVTKRLKDAGEILGIKVLDHIIVVSQRDGCASFDNEEKLHVWESH